MKKHVPVLVARLASQLYLRLTRLFPRTSVAAIMALLFATTRLQGQVASNYTFSSTLGTYSTALTGQTTIFPAGWSALVANVQLPFVFYFNGKGYSSVWVSSNGYITFGATAPNPAYNNPISNNNGFDGSVSAFGLNNSGSTAALVDANNVNPVVCGTQTSGGNTVFVIQWATTWRRPVRASGYADAINFQIRLFQNTNVVEIMYGSCTTTIDFAYPNLWSPMVGIGGASTTDFNVRTKTATGTLSTSNTTAGTTSSSYLIFGSLSTIPAGLTMDWTPASSPSACSGTPTAPVAVANKGIACSSVGLSLAGLPNATGLTYQWYQSYTGLNGSFTSISGATNATLTPTLTQATYYNCMVSCGASSVFSSSVGVGRESTCPAAPTYTNNGWYYESGNGIVMASFILPSGANTCGTSFSDASASGSGYNQGYTTGTCYNYMDMTYMPPIKLQAGTIYSGGTLTAGFTNPMYAAIWIDFNDDGVFTTAEQVGSVSAATNSSANNMTITIPSVAAGAYYGLHRMRVRTAYNATVTSATANMSYGNTKDYMVSILPPNQTITASPVVPPATICAPGAVETLTAATNISTGTLSSSSYTYTWSGPSGFGSSVNSTANTTTFTPTSTAFSGVYTVTSVSNGAQACAISTINVVVATSASAPNNPPGALTVTGNTYQGASNITFTPYSTVPDGYLIVATNSSTAPTNPVDGTTYATGTTGSFGANSVVISGSVYGSAPPYSTATLNSNSQYYLYVYPFNIDCSGPKYYTSYPVLIGNTLTTCIAPPTGLTATAPTGSTVNLSWTAAAGGGNPSAVISSSTYTYTVHAYLDAGLTTEAVGYPISGITGTSYTASGLSVGTTYYFVVSSTAPGAACGSNSLPASNTTLCTGAASVPLLQNFESSAVGNLSPNCWTGNAAQLSGAGGVYKNGGYVGAPFSARSGLNYYLFLGTGYTTTVYANQWLVSPALSLTPGTYNVQFWYVSNSSWTGLKAQYSTSGSVPSYTTTDMTGAVAIGSALSSVNTGTWTLYSGTMTITTAGTYYVGIDAQSASNSLSMAIEDFEICKVPTVAASNGTAPYCALATVTLNSTGSSDVNKYTWTGPSGFTSSSSSTVVSGLDVGVYTYSLTGVNDPITSGFGGYCSTGPVTTTFTVTPGPAAITGTAAICPGQTLSLNETTTGGTWSSSTTSVATVNTSGVVTGVAAGTAIISYKATCGGVATTVVTVDYTPGAISGNFNVCAGLTTTLSNTIGGGTWTSGTTANATVGLTNGVVTGMSAGTSIITYMLGGCPATSVVTVTAALPAITGTAIVCPTTVTTLNIAATGGSWSSSNSNISIGTSSGVVTGATAGTSVVTYTSGVCYGTKVVTVSSLPTATIGASGPICAGGIVTLTATPAGSTDTYSWAGASLASTTNASTTATPSATNTYSLTTSNSAIAGCPTSMYTVSVTVRTAPTAAPANDGPICSGGTVSLTANLGGSTTNYSWAGPDLSSTTATNPTATPTSPAVYTLSVTDGTTDAGCSNTYTTPVTVNPTPIAAPANDGLICTGGTVHLSANPGGGANTYTWVGPDLSSTTEENPSASPTATSVYSLTVTNGTSASGCAPATVYTTSVTVNTPPTAAPSNSGTICSGGTVTLTANPADGASTYSWSGANLSSTTDQSPTATPTTTSVYSLTVTNGTSASGCSPVTIYTTSVTVKSTPTAAPTNNGYICTGGTVDLAANPAGGATTFTWSGSNIGTTNAENTSATPIATSVYSLVVSDGTTDPGCSPATVYTTSVSVHATPSANPANDGYICAGGTVSLSANPADGAINFAWSGSDLSSTNEQNPTATPGATTVYSLTVSDGSSQSGCAPATVYTTSVTVNNAPTAAPANDGPICAGGTITLTAVPSDGASVYTWSGANLSSTTAQDPTATPTTTSVYSLTVSDGSGKSGCSPATVYTTSVTVRSTPTAAPANDGYICNGGTVNLTANPSGGATVFNWSGSDLASGNDENTTATPTATTVYSLTVSDGSGASGCAPSTVYTTSVTVNNVPTASPANSGSICVGGTVTLTANPANGANTFSWSGPGLLAIFDQDPDAAPTATTVYSLTVTDGSGKSGCSPATVYTTSVTVRPMPTAAPGNDGYICAGGTVNLSANAADGATVFTWSGSNMGSTNTENTTATPIANSTYSLTVSDGTTDPGCSPGIVYTTNVTVHATPTASPASDGPICVSGTVTLTANPANGVTVYTWSGAGLASATTENPVATPATSAVYSLTVSDGSTQSGCTPTTVYTTSVTVNNAPSLTQATNDGPICAGTTLHLSANGATNVTSYSWTGPDAISNANTAAADVATATTAASGIYTVVVNNGTGSGCTATYTTTATVNDLPTVASVTPSATQLCDGAAVTFTAGTASGSGTLVSYNWNGPGGYTATTANGTITIDPVTTAASGTYSLSVTYSGSGCVSNMATATIIVNSRPVVGTLDVSPSALCAGEQATLAASAVSGTGAVLSYTWSGPAGYTSTTTTDVQTYTIPGPTAAGAYSVSVTYEGVGCISDMVASSELTVNPAPSAGTISGVAEICPTTTSTLSATVTGGVWSSDAAGIATIDASSGVVSGVAEGNATISYAVTNSCGTAYATYTMTIHPLPAAGTITGTAALCPATTTTLSSGAPGGIWSSSTTAVATIASGGAVTSVAPGTSFISYAVTNFCGTAYAIKEVTVNVLPVAGTISGTTHVCPSATVTLSSTATGGTWSSAAPSTASVSTAGVVTGVTAGAASISYSYTNSCGTDIATYAMTVDPAPVVTPITGTAKVCPGTTATLSDATTGGVWSTSATGIATVGTSGIVSGVAAGTATISYTTSTVCGSISATSVTTVDPVPNAGVISGPSIICFMSTITLSSTISGGTWSSSAATIAPITSAGIVSGITVGSSNISYTVGSSCGLTATSVYSVAVSPLPNAGVISGTGAICVGETLTLSSTAADGTWQSASSAIATVGTSGVVQGVASGTTMITYRYTNVCGTDIATTMINVNVTNIPVVDITMTPSVVFDPGTTVTFTANVTNGGITPAYEWSVDGTVISGATNNAYTTSALANGSLISCHVKGIGACDMPSFNTIMVQFLTSTATIIGRDEIVVAPNPNKGSFFIKGVIKSPVDDYSYQLTDMLGRIVSSGIAHVENGMINERVSLSDQLANGMYLLTLRTPDGKARTFHIVIEQ